VYVCEFKDCDNWRKREKKKGKRKFVFECLNKYTRQALNIRNGNFLLIWKSQNVNTDIEIKKMFDTLPKCAATNRMGEKIFSQHSPDIEYFLSLSYSVFSLICPTEWRSCESCFAWFARCCEWFGRWWCEGRLNWWQTLNEKIIFKIFNR
jgi:hypothetical protein